MAVNTGTNWNAYDAATMTAREIYGRTLAELGKTNDRIVGVTADLANTTAIVHFANAFPDRFFNVGIAEQNMFGVAPACESRPDSLRLHHAIFACLRGGEQSAPILRIKTSGKDYRNARGNLLWAPGTTHHCTEDFAVMRSIANMTVICPADGLKPPWRFRLAPKRRDVYIRIGRGFGAARYANADHEFEIGKAITMRDGTDLTIICCGIAVLQSMQAAKTLAEQDGISVRVVNMHTIKPIDRDVILKAVTDTRRILTVEEHTLSAALETRSAA
jgi:transketolase